MNIPHSPELGYTIQRVLRKGVTRFEMPGGRIITLRENSEGMIAVIPSGDALGKGRAFVVNPDGHTTIPAAHRADLEWAQVIADYGARQADIPVPNTISNNVAAPEIIYRQVEAARHAAAAEAPPVVEATPIYEQARASVDRPRQRTRPVYDRDSTQEAIDAEFNRFVREGLGRDLVTPAQPRVADVAEESTGSRLARQLRNAGLGREEPVAPPPARRREPGPMSHFWPDPRDARLDTTNPRPDIPQTTRPFRPTGSAFLPTENWN